MQIPSGINLSSAIAKWEKEGRSKQSAKRLFMAGAQAGINGMVEALKNPTEKYTPADVLEMADKVFEKQAKQAREQL